MEINFSVSLNYASFVVFLIFGKRRQARNMMTCIKAAKRPLDEYYNKEWYF
jgi:hypothetical protein